MPGVYQRKDHYFEQAKREGYRSRAAYKLTELNKRHKLIRSGMSVLDLGCAPGSWLQVALEQVGPRGKVIGVDLERVSPLSTARGSAVDSSGDSDAIILQADITDVDTFERILAHTQGPLDVILSDISPKLSGIRFRDAAFSAELVESAFSVASRLLRKGGSFVAKVFPGEETDLMAKELTRQFASFSRVNLETTRKSSTEMYFVGKKFLPGAKP